MVAGTVVGTGRGVIGKECVDIKDDLVGGGVEFSLFIKSVAGAVGFGAFVSACRDGAFGGQCVADGAEGEQVVGVGGGVFFLVEGDAQELAAVDGAVVHAGDVQGRGSALGFGVVEFDGDAECEGNTGPGALAGDGSCDLRVGFGGLGATENHVFAAVGSVFKVEQSDVLVLPGGILVEFDGDMVAVLIDQGDVVDVEARVVGSDIGTAGDVQTAGAAFEVLTVGVDHAKVQGNIGVFGGVVVGIRAGGEQEHGACAEEGFVHGTFLGLGPWRKCSGQGRFAG